MARVTVKLYATLRPYRSRLDSDSTVAIADAATVRTLADQLEIPHHLIYTIIVNGEHCDAETQLKDGDEVALFPPIAGGTGMSNREPQSSPKR